MRQKRRPEAVVELERLSKENPTDRIARTALIAGYLATDRIASAESILNAVTPEALLQDGLLKLAKQDFVGSRAALVQALNATTRICGL